MYTTSLYTEFGTLCDQNMVFKDLIQLILL